MHGLRFPSDPGAPSAMRGRTGSGASPPASRVLVTRDFSLTDETIASSRIVRHNVRADALMSLLARRTVRPFFPVGWAGPQRGGTVAKRPTPIERFIADIPSDRRRAYDARQAKAGLVRVTVTVPFEHAESLKTFARLLRNSDPSVISMYRTWLEEYLRDTYADWDEAEAEGRL